MTPDGGRKAICSSIRLGWSIYGHRYLLNISRKFIELLQGSKRPVKDVNASCRPDSLGFRLLASERAKPVLTKGQQLRGRKVLS